MRETERCAVVLADTLGVHARACTRTTVGRGDRGFVSAAVQLARDARGSPVASFQRRQTRHVSGNGTWATGGYAVAPVLSTRQGEVGDSPICLFAVGRAPACAPSCFRRCIISAPFASPADVSISSNQHNSTPAHHHHSCRARADDDPMARPNPAGASPQVGSSAMAPSLSASSRQSSSSRSSTASGSTLADLTACVRRTAGAMPPPLVSCCA